jgi:outer membrane PBP1 activator LpoA protein
MNMNAISLTAAVLTSALLFTACASTPPPPTASMKLAQQAIATAEQNEAGHYAPGELANARNQLAAADVAITEKKMITAKQLAEEASADAEFASAKTADAKANAVNDEMRHGTATLIQEMQRNAGAQQ